MSIKTEVRKIYGVKFDLKLNFGPVWVGERAIQYVICGSPKFALD